MLRAVWLPAPAYISINECSIFEDGVLINEPQFAQLPGSLCPSAVPQQGHGPPSMSILQARQRTDLDCVLVVYLPANLIREIQCLFTTQGADDAPAYK